VLAVVGDQFDDCGESRSSEDEPPEICGCTISVRQSEDVLSIWNREGNDTKVTERIKWVLLYDLKVISPSNRFIRDTIRRVLNISPMTVMEYKTNNGAHLNIYLSLNYSFPWTDSMRDKPNFPSRNFNNDRTPS